MIENLELPHSDGKRGGVPLASVDGRTGLSRILGMTHGSVDLLARRHAFSACCACVPCPRSC
ncbi:hypothetical protein GS426_11090 [Rhodococcus hoagii]|nr:hypothetical protein [Prescottella equi]